MSGKFSAHFQLPFVAFMLRDSDFLSRVWRDVKPEYFQDEVLQRVVRFVLDFYEEQKSAPDVLLLSLLDTYHKQGLINSELHQLICLYCDQNLFTCPLQNRQYLENEFNNFVWHQRMQTKLVPLMDAVQKEDRKTAEMILKSMLIRPNEDRTRTVWYTADPTIRVERRKKSERDLLWSLIPAIDEVCPGLRRGQIMLWQSRMSSDGKTAALVFMTKAALFQRKRVLIITLEEDTAEYEDKLDMCLAGIAKDRLTDAAYIRRRVSRFTDRGQLCIREFPPGKTTIADLRADLEILRATKNFWPDVIMLDYPDKLDCGDKSLRGNLGAMGEKIYLDFEAWLKEDNLFGVAVTQSNRGATQKAKADQGEVAGSYAKIQIAQRVISINRDPELDKENKLRLHLVKNRGGQKGLDIDIHFDFSRMLFYVSSLD